MPRKPVDHDEIARLRERDARLQRLTEYPEWQELVDALTERRENSAESLAKRILSPAAVPQEEVEQLGTFWGGVFAVLETPAHVHKRLENKLKRANAEVAQHDEGDA